MAYRRTLLTRTVVAIGIAGAVIAVNPGAARAGAALAEPKPWTASLQSGRAAGTVTTTTSPGLPTSQRKDITGSLTSSAPDECYRVQVVVARDLASWPYDVADHCGTGSTSFSTSATATTVTTSIGIRVCRVVNGAVTQCGSITRV